MERDRKNCNTLINIVMLRFYLRLEKVCKDRNFSVTMRLIKCHIFGGIERDAILP